MALPVGNKILLDTSVLVDFLRAGMHADWVLEPVGGRVRFLSSVVKGCWSQGPTREETLDSVREAIEAWLEVEQDKAEQAGGPLDVELINV